VSNCIGIPVVFDTHHFTCYKLLHPDEEFEKEEYYIPKILQTWKMKNIKPKFHISEQGSGRCGHHSDYIETIPNYLLEIPEKYNTEFDILVEAKMKEQAIFKLYRKYPFLDCKILH
jgi:UV DNA damage endonuclease